VQFVESGFSFAGHHLLMRAEVHNFTCRQKSGPTDDHDATGRQVFGTRSLIQRSHRRCLEP
jgi:hypothetical protein